MISRRLRQFIGIAVALFAGGAGAARGGEERGKALLEAIAPGPDRGLVIEDPHLVEPVPNPWAKEGLDPVWRARIAKAGKECGYLMWEKDAAGKLVEFSLSRSESVAGEHCLAGVTNVQQFGVPGISAPEVCSGCVPTAAANLVAYWSAHGFPQWGAFLDDKKPTRAELEAQATRLRSLLKMQEIADTLGYTDDRRPLAGAMPEDLAKALQKDAADRGVKATVEFTKFSAERLRSEIAGGRPVLVSCVVRLPQKPQLSWGHEIIGIGWTEIGGDTFVAVHDNFYPSEEIDTRWIRADAFESMIVVVPEAS